MKAVNCLIHIFSFLLTAFYKIYRLDIFNKIKPPYNINQVTQEIAWKKLRESNQVFEQVMPMDFQSFTVSEPEFTLGQTYQVQINGEDITTVTLETVITRFGNAGRGGPRGERGEKKGWW